MEKDYAKIRAEAKLAETRSRHREAMRYLTISIVVIAAVLLAWQLAVQLGLVSTRFFDSPVGVVETIITKITDKARAGEGATSNARIDTVPNMDDQSRNLVDERRVSMRAPEKVPSIFPKK